MKTIKMESMKHFPFAWANLEYYKESNGHGVEIYLRKNHDLLAGFKLLFNKLFRKYAQGIELYSPSWWDYCLDTWDIESNEYNYEPEGKSLESSNYITMLTESAIELDYSGVCTCNDWDKFLKISLHCIISRIAPYSPIFFNAENEFFFYFHHSGSIGFYFRIYNTAINEILEIARSEFEIK